MLYGMYGLEGLNHTTEATPSGHYGFRIRNTAPAVSNWWRVVEVEFFAVAGYVGKYGAATVIASSELANEPAGRAFDGNLTTTGTTYTSGWGSSQNENVIGQYIGLRLPDRVPLRSARWLTWGGAGHAMDAVALDVLTSSPGQTETWRQIAELSGAAVGGQWFGWEDLG